MNRMARLTLSLGLGIVGLLAVLLALRVPSAVEGSIVEGLILTTSAQPAAHAAGNTIYVPDDYLTIQEAIDAAVDGDEIWVKLGFYDGDLSIDKGISLIGGWNNDFTARNVPTQTSIIQGNGMGRGISITTATSDTVVTIDGFTIKDGNATGLGGSPLPTSLAAKILHHSTAADADFMTPAERLTPAEHLARLQSSLTGVVERGLYPGGVAAYQDTLERVEQYFAHVEETPLQSRSTAEPSQGTADCGGGIYSWNASLHLLNSVIQGNLASFTGSGLGGGVCVGQSAPSGTHIAGNIFLGNIASAASDSPGPGAIFGDGGGLYVTQVPGAVIEDNTFEGNVASTGSAGPQATTVGSGGGLYVYSSDNVVLRRNEFLRNTASHGWYAFAGDGGGAFLYWAEGATVADNVFAENLAALDSMCAGGGLLVLLSDDVLIDGNELTKNWACLVGTDAADNRGGGIMVVTFDGVTVSDNILSHNTTAVSGPNIGTSAGGGLNVEDGSDARITGNTIQGNVACQTGIGYGGGMSLWGVKDGLVADNIILDNVGSLSGGRGAGGGLNLRLTQNFTVRNNRFRGNLAVAEGTGLVGGGGVSISIDQLYSPSVNTTLEANSFFGNKDSADPVQLSLGGGACFARSDGFTFTNNVVAGNTATEGSALFLGQTRRTAVTNNTLAGNSGNSGVFVGPLNDPPIVFTNNIVVSHTEGIRVDEATLTVRYTLWHGNDTNIAGSGTITHTHPVTGTPAFADPAVDDYHITIGSAARDAGDPAGVPPAPPTDRDDVPRPQGLAVDLGAYEWRGYWLYLPLAMKD
jgi:hypothetical protein